MAKKPVAVFALFSLFGAACFMPPAPRQPTSRLTKQNPVNEAAVDPGSNTAIDSEKAADSSGTVSKSGGPREVPRL